LPAVRTSCPHKVGSSAMDERASSLSSASRMRNPWPMSFSLVSIVVPRRS
jgi:hypothetical protein